MTQQDTPQPYAMRIRKAAPAGGARIACRRGGCWGAFAAALVLSGPGAAQTAPVDVPSGQPVTLNEVLLDETPGTLWVRFRFVAPRIGKDAGQITFDVAAIDMDHLCDAVAIPYLDNRAITAERVVVSMSDRAVEFGASDPDATQFFGAYRLENARCIWEEF